MTIDQFVEKWLGKKIDFDGFYDGQCMDLYHQYCHEFGYEHPPASGAYKLWGYTWTDFVKKNNTPTAVPEKGDIVIWNTKAGGGYGHVAIFLTGDIDGFTSLDQNWPTLSKVTKTKHNYQNIYGWLHPLKETMSNELDECLKQHTELVDACNKKDNEIAGHKARATDMEKQKGVAEAKLKTAEETISSLNSQLLSEADKLKDLNTSLKTANTRIKELEGDIETIMEAKGKLAIDYAELKAGRTFDELVRLSIKDWKSSIAIIKYK